LNSYLGSAFSFQPILTQSAWFRPHNRSEEFDNLYFVGAGTHPGAGMPGVLSSAIIVDNLIGASATHSAVRPELVAQMGA
jgi:phytoene desaturase